MYFHFCHSVIACNGNSIHVKVDAYLNGHPVYTYGGNEFFHGDLVGYGTQCRRFAADIVSNTGTSHMASIPLA